MKAALLVVLVFLLVVSGCGKTTVSSDMPEGTISVTGIVQVLHAGTRSETVVITNDATGEVFALMGEKALDIVPEYGQLTAVIGRLTEEGYSVRENLQKIYVMDYSMIGIEEVEDY